MVQKAALRGGVVAFATFLALRALPAIRREDHYLNLCDSRSDCLILLARSHDAGNVHVFLPPSLGRRIYIPTL